MRKQIDGDPSSEAAEAKKTARELEAKGITVTADEIDVVEVKEELKVPKVKEKPSKKKEVKKEIKKKRR